MRIWHEKGIWEFFIGFLWMRILKDELNTVNIRNFSITNVAPLWPLIKLIDATESISNILHTENWKIHFKKLNKCLFRKSNMSSHISLFNFPQKWFIISLSTTKNPHNNHQKCARERKKFNWIELILIFV